ncbi:baeRF10 domain-containing protein [[Eubacterium] cellulosolvens]
MLQDINDEKLKDLASIYDDKDTFISLYLDISHDIDWRFIDHRERQCETALKTDKYLLEIFHKNMGNVRTFLEKDFKRESIGKHIKGLAMFVSGPMEYFGAFGLPHKISNGLVVDTSPYIRQLAQLMDEWENYAMVLINNNEAEMFVISLGAVRDQKHLTAHIMNKHKKGGWSQMRFQRLRREAIDHFQKKVRETLEDFILSEEIVGLILAGPGEAKVHFKKSLSQQLSQRVLGVLDYDMDEPTEKLIEAATQEVAKQEREKSAEAVKRLKNEILKGGRAVFGVKETVNATREGQAELLILSKELKPRGWICEHCQAVETGMKKVCPYCGKRTSEVDVLEEILEFAERAGTHIEFVGDNPMLEELGGVGALLRY